MIKYLFFVFSLLGSSFVYAVDEENSECSIYNWQIVSKDTDSRDIYLYEDVVDPDNEYILVGNLEGCGDLRLYIKQKWTKGEKEQALDYYKNYSSHICYYNGQYFIGALNGLFVRTRDIQTGWVNLQSSIKMNQTLTQNLLLPYKLDALEFAGLIDDASVPYCDD